jgi:hypothetical protein
MAERWWAFAASLLEDGWEHKRSPSGFCENCGATRHEPHYLLQPKEEKCES